MRSIFNFSAGPAQLPDAVLMRMKDELINWNGHGMSVAEISHRSNLFEEIAWQSEKDLRDLLNISSDYHVLFLSGGGRGQFGMIPMNFGWAAPYMAYAETGTWSRLALEEAQRIGRVHVAMSSAKDHYHCLPPQSTWNIPEDAAYFHYTDNETIHGVEFPEPPHIPCDVPLISDMSSNLLSRPIDIKKFSLVYACAQKNLGIAGVTVVVVHKDLLKKKTHPILPSMWSYQQHVEARSFLNTPPTYPWYVSGLMFQWVKEQGGVLEMERRSLEKSSQLYAYIDSSDFYINPIQKEHRSRMNVPFFLHQKNLDTLFLKEAQAAGLKSLKGHNSVGGMRASLYNGMPESGVLRLIEFMKDFQNTHG